LAIGSLHFLQLDRPLFACSMTYLLDIASLRRGRGGKKSEGVRTSERARERESARVRESRAG
jgi:hypothetical protein